MGKIDSLINLPGSYRFIDRHHQLQEHDLVEEELFIFTALAVFILGSRSHSKFSVEVMDIIGLYFMIPIMDMDKQLNCKNFGTSSFLMIY